MEKRRKEGRRERRREEEKEGGREGGREGGKEEGKEGGREGGSEGLIYRNHNQFMTKLLTLMPLRWYVSSTAQPEEHIM